MTRHAPLRVWRPPGFEGLELTAYDGDNRPFPPSLLTGFNFGVRLQGVRETTYRKNRFHSGPGTFLAYAPGVGLAAKPVSDGAWSHRDMSFTPALLATLLGLQPSRLEDAALWGTVETGMNDLLFTRFVRSHASMTQPASWLERETNLLLWLRPLLRAFGKSSSRLGREHRSVAQVKAYLEAHTAQDVRLADLARVTGLHEHYLLRVFKHEVGVSPHQYQASLRLAKAKALLGQGLTAAQAALEVGVYDQSGLNRLFKRHLFVTPGQYRKALQYQ